MKQKILYIVVLLLLHFQTFGQDSISNQPCIKLFNSSVKAFIPGYKDSIIKRNYVRNGFELILSDTSYTVVKYYIVFDFGTDLISIPSEGSRLMPTQKKYADNLYGIKPRSMLTVESITITKNAVCYIISPLLYFIME